MLTQGQARDLAVELGEAAAPEWRRLQTFRDYLRGHHRPPYTPRTATGEYRELARRAVTNLCPLVVEGMTDRLFVDGYRSSPLDPDNAAPWAWWQANRLDARQAALYDAVGTFGYGYVLTLPGDPVPVMRPLSPRLWWADYADPLDDHPRAAYTSRKIRGRTQTTVVDEDAVYTLEDRDDGNGPRLVRVVRHGVGVCPVVRFVGSHDLEDTPVGLLEPILTVQDRLNQTVFDLLMGQTFAAFRQRWVTGMALPEAPVDANGDPIPGAAPARWEALVDRVWQAESPDTRFGQLDEANLSQLVEVIGNVLRVFGLVSSTPPHDLLGELVNLSAEALTAAEANRTRKVEGWQTNLGESWELAFQTAALAAGDDDAASDTASQVVWRNTEPRSVGQVVDALGKLATMLGVPTRALWERVPGVTQTDVVRWEALAEQSDPLAALTATLDRQADPAAPVP